MTKLTIASTNEDYCGTWTKEEVEKEMQEVGSDAYKNDQEAWLEWVFDHIFDDLGYPVNLLNALKSSFVISATITMNLNGYRTVFTMERDQYPCCIGEFPRS